MKKIIAILLLTLVVLPACSSKKEETANIEVTNNAVEETKTEDITDGVQSPEYVEMDAEWLKYSIFTPSEFFSAIKEYGDSFFNYFFYEPYGNELTNNVYENNLAIDDITNDLDRDIEDLCSSMGEKQFAVVYGVYSGYFEDRDNEYFKIPDQIEGYDVLAVGFDECIVYKDEYLPPHIVCPEKTMFISTYSKAPIITGNSLVIFDGVINQDNFNNYFNDSKLLVGLIDYEDSCTPSRFPDIRYGKILNQYGGFGSEDLIIDDNCNFLQIEMPFTGIKKIDINAEHMIYEGIGISKDALDELIIRKNVKNIRFNRDNYLLVHNIRFEKVDKNHYVKVYFDNLIIDDASDNICVPDDGPGIDYFSLTPNGHETTVKNLSGKAIDWNFIFDSYDPKGLIEAGTIDYKGEFKLTIEGSGNSGTTAADVAGTESKENSETFRIRIITNSIKIRSTPSAPKDNSNKVGNAKKGEEYTVYEKTSNEGYTWYRIGDDQWIADDGTWVERID